MEPSAAPRITDDVTRVAGLLDAHEGMHVETLARLMGDRGWPAERTRETVRAAVVLGYVYSDCRHTLHAV